VEFNSVVSGQCPIKEIKVEPQRRNRKLEDQINTQKNTIEFESDYFQTTGFTINQRKQTDLPIDTKKRKKGKARSKSNERVTESAWEAHPPILIG
jgi:hypothetical protein